MQSLTVEAGKGKICEACLCQSLATSPAHVYEGKQKAFLVRHFSEKRKRIIFRYYSSHS